MIARPPRIIKTGTISQNKSSVKIGRAVASSIISGVLLVLSLPKPDLYPLAWIALVPLLVLLGAAQSVARTVLVSYIAGVVFFSGTFYWITETMVIYGGLSSPLAVGVGALFALSYALYFVLFALAVHFVIKKFGTAGLLFSAPLWVTMEWLRVRSVFRLSMDAIRLCPCSLCRHSADGRLDRCLRSVISGDAGEQPHCLLHIAAQ